MSDAAEKTTKTIERETRDGKFVTQLFYQDGVLVGSSEVFIRKQKEKCNG